MYRTDNQGWVDFESDCRFHEVPKYAWVLCNNKIILDLPESPIFQQDGAPLRWAFAVQRYLDDKVSQLRTGRQALIAGLKIFSELDPLDFNFEPTSRTMRSQNIYNPYLISRIRLCKLYRKLLLKFHKSCENQATNNWTLFYSEWST